MIVLLLSLVITLACAQARAESAPASGTWSGTVEVAPCECGGVTPTPMPPTPTPPPPPPTAPPPTAFSDEFNGTALSIDDGGTGANKWYWRWFKYNVNHLAGNSDDFFKMHDNASYNSGPTAGAALKATGKYGAGPYLHEVSNGTLKLRAYPTPENMKPTIWHMPYLASMITTERGYNFKTNTPGSVEVRYRNKTQDKGSHTAIWLMDINGDWPPEIDMVESIRKDKNGNGPFFFTNAHGAPAGPTFLLNNSDFEYPGAAAWEDWQVFRLEYSAAELVWKRNGNIVRKQKNYLGARNMYFLITLEGASNWPGDPDATTRWPQEVEIDYVRMSAGASATASAQRSAIIGTGRSIIDGHRGPKAAAPKR